jgi:hypothetical protein
MPVPGQPEVAPGNPGEPQVYSLELPSVKKIAARGIVSGLGSSFQRTPKCFRPPAPVPAVDADALLGRLNPDEEEHQMRGRCWHL